MARIPAADKDAWLKELIESDDPHAAMRIKLKLQAAVVPKPAPVDPVSTMKAGELLEQYRNHTRKLDEEVQLQKEIKRKKETAAAAAAHEKHLDQQRLWEL